ncbi:FecR family protein [Zunongwangia atlantica]|uniref:Anti-FecI sigma factor FecR n=1 Tax=Zunongwangia atlantica 22II14-10F7 TaxID=1185767 RepID=A0A1Y1T6W6_9FLAO|nr:FecR family protein [Zunongwangia atlantica]ORL46807.1 anti-FecI sigma factor FecR [Zunongwangia atlantica 22II14-10F7]
MKKSEIDKNFDEFWKEETPENPLEVKEKSWKNFYQTNYKKQKSTLTHFTKYAAAIAILVILGLSFFTINEPATETASLIHIENPGNISKLIFLPDSSEIRLKPKSKITYTKDYSTNREIRLHGNAFFKVKKDQNHPFKVISNKTLTTVLGTSFTITENTAQTHVKLHQGKVKMNIRGKAESWILSPGEEFILDDGNPKIQNFKNHVDFEKASIKSIISFLKEEYGFKITISTVFLNKQSTLRIKKEEDIEIPIKILAEIYNLNYSIDRLNTIVIFKKQESTPTNNIIKE